MGFITENMLLSIARYQSFLSLIGLPSLVTNCQINIQDTTQWALLEYQVRTYSYPLRKLHALEHKANHLRLILLAMVLKSTASPMHINSAAANHSLPTLNLSGQQQ